MLNESKFKLNLTIFAYVAFMMLFFAASSPLIGTIYYDQSVFRTMGRAMVEGKIMYKDVFDHKGLYLYFINALAVILTPNSFTGLFVIECVFMFLCARIVYAILSKYADWKISFIGMQIFLVFAFMRDTFSFGNLTETYGLLPQIFSIYILLKDDNKFSCLHMFLQGLSGGIIMLFRLNLIMMWGGIAIIAGYEMLRQKKFGRLAGNVIAGFSGLAVGIAPAVIYAVINDSVRDTIFGMLTYNMLYVGNNDSGIIFPAEILMRLIHLINPMIMGKNCFILVCVIAMSCFLIVRKYKEFSQKKYYFAMLFMSAVSMALSGRNYGHYYEYAVPFCLPFAYWIGSSLKKFSVYKYICVLVALMTLVMGGRIPYAVKLMIGRKTESISFQNIQQRFLKYNEPYHSATERLLVVREWALIYDALGVIPQEKYFYVPSSEYDVFTDPRDAQATSIISGVNDVIFVGFRNPEESVDYPEIFPETGRSDEIRETLSNQYILLHYDEKMRIAMYGKKR